MSDVTEETEEIDQSVWENLGARIDNILEDKYVSAQTSLFAAGNFNNVLRHMRTSCILGLFIWSSTH